MGGAVKGVLVAVGLGEQVARRTWHGAHLLCPSLERPPVDQAIDAFAHAGFEEVAVIVGHNEDVLWRYLEDSARYGIAVYCLHNAQYLRGSATAIYAARAFVGGEPFVVSLSSHAITANMLLSLRARAWGTHAVCVDRHGRRHRQYHDATKVWLDEQGCVRRIGQDLRHWHALSTGAFLFQPDVFGHVSELLRGDGDCSVSALVRHMIAYGEAPYACSVSPRWDGMLGADHLLLWTAPMLSARLAPERLLA
jgi:choline kinase